MGSEERILLVRLSHLGDVVHALPLFHALRARHSHARIAWVVQREYAELVGRLAGLERAFAFDRRGGARAWLALREELAAFEPTLVIDAQGNLKSAAVALAAGSGERIGLALADWREKLGALAMHARVSPANGSHAVDRMLALAGGVPEPSFELSLSQPERALGRELCERFLPGAERAVVIALAHPHDVRAWPLEHARELARSLAREGARVVLLSGPEEAGCGARLQAELDGEPGVSHWVGQRGLRELAAFFTASAERGGTFVGCDSGPMHLAWACGMRVLCLSGPQSHLRTGPWPVPDRGPSPHVVVRATEPPSCAPCLSRRCSHPDGPVCMRAIAPEQVRRQLGSTEPGSFPPALGGNGELESNGQRW